MITEIVETLNDEQVMLSFIETQDSRYFELLVSRYSKKLYNIAYSLLGNSNEAEDTVQEAFVRILRNRDKFRKDACFSRWVFTIVQNLCKDVWRRRRSKQNFEASFKPLTIHESSGALVHYDEPPEDKMPNQTSAVEFAEEKERVLSLLGKLPNNQKTAIVMREVEGLSYRSIASLLGIPIGTVRSRLHYGRERLRKIAL